MAGPSPLRCLASPCRHPSPSAAAPLADQAVPGASYLCPPAGPLALRVLGPAGYQGSAAYPAGRPHGRAADDHARSPLACHGFPGQATRAADQAQRPGRPAVHAPVHSVGLERRLPISRHFPQRWRAASQGPPALSWCHAAVHRDVTGELGPAQTSPPHRIFRPVGRPLAAASSCPRRASFPVAASSPPRSPGSPAPLALPGFRSGAARPAAPAAVPVGRRLLLHRPTDRPLVYPARSASRAWADPSSAAPGHARSPCWDSPPRAFR